MKLHQISSLVINLDAIEYVDMNNNKIHFVSGNSITMNDDELKMFVYSYNGQNTDEIEKAVKKLLRIARLNPDLLTREGMRDAIISLATRNALQKDVKRLTQGKMLKDLPMSQLAKVYKEILKISEEFERKLGF